ncbi:recombinase-like helix-turn-helix domain-containing protein [Streptomyces sulphureus]|uniref:recombinase-like helix-turn-helix domain-containing protein n=1 Tax=Streptomyces sulphureus TaxID=47758 RepID=UPI00035F8166|nr:recombinase-like helix-turn-helix domain-containing protein [Streptomyces sulphureus]
MSNNPQHRAWPYLEPHQTRDADPTPYELKLAATLEEVYTQDGHDLATVVDGLNSRLVHAPDGLPWTEESFRTEIHRLGA